MAYIEEIKKGESYRLYANLGKLPNGKYRRRTKKVKASGKKEANKLAQEFEDEQLERLSYNENMFFSDFVDKWKENFASIELEQSTFERYLSILKYITYYFEPYQLKEISSLTIIEYFNYERKNNRGSLGNKYKILRSIFKYAVKWKIIKAEDNPMNNVDKPKNSQAQKNKDFYRTEEIHLMLKLLKDQPEEQQLIVQLALVGGLRRGEIIGITHDAIDFQSNSILIKRSLQQTNEGIRLKGTKTNDIRTIILPDKLMERIHDLYLKKLNMRMEMGNLWKGYQDEGKDVVLLFSNEYGKPYRPDSVTQFWNRFTVKHEDKLRRVRFHDLRHSSATLLLSEGINMKVIQKRLGHKNIKTTLNLYSHISEKEDEKASNVFDDIL